MAARDFENLLQVNTLLFMLDYAQLNNFLVRSSCIRGVITRASQQDGERIAVHDGSLARDGQTPYA